MWCRRFQILICIVFLLENFVLPSELCMDMFHQNLIFFLGGGNSGRDILSQDKNSIIYPLLQVGSGRPKSPDPQHPGYL